MPRKKSVSSEGASSSQPAKKFKADTTEQPDPPVRRSLRNRTQDENLEHDHMVSINVSDMSPYILCQQTAYQ